MVETAPNGAAKDVELSQSDKSAAHEAGEDSLDKAHKEKRELPSFFPSHGLTTAGAESARWIDSISTSTAVLGSLQHIAQPATACLP